MMGMMDGYGFWLVALGGMVVLLVLCRVAGKGLAELYETYNLGGDDDRPDPRPPSTPAD
jgi:hypothetical protein